MQGEKGSHVQFDDRAALQELERLQRSIQEYRRRREEAEGAFEQFVGSFKKPSVPDEGAAAVAPNAPLPGFHTRPASGAIVPPVAPAAAVQRPAVAAPVTAAPLTPVRPAAPDTPVSPPAATRWEAPVSEVALPPANPVGTPEIRAGDSAIVAAEPPEAPAPAVSLPDNFFAGVNSSPAFEDGRAGTSASPRSKSKSGTWLLLALGATGSALVVGALLVRSDTTATPPTEPAVTVGAPAAERPPAAPPSAATASAPGAAPSAAPAAVAAPTVPPPPAEVRTARSVWVRVTVDGARAVERELAADSRVVLPAGRSYVIRSGDAGAVRFLLNGEDQGPLGSDAQVVTRTFTARQP